MKRCTLPVAVVAVLFLTSGCGKKAGTGEQGTGTPVDVAGVKALVPAALKDTLVFEQRELVDDFGSKTTTFTVAAPKGWKPNEHAVGVEISADKDTLGSRTKMSLSKDCDGRCEPKDWAALVDKRVKNMGDGKVVKDVKGARNRLVIVEQPFAERMRLELLFAWWSDDQPQYWTCNVTLDDEAKTALPAFEKACQAVGVMVTKN